MALIVIAGTALVTPVTIGTLWNRSAYQVTAAPVLAKGRKDYVTGVLGQGIGRISGTIMKKGAPNVPVYARVRLIRERDFLPVREMWSDPTSGAYSFDYVDELQKYTVIAFDHTHDERAVIGDNLTPDLIT